MRILAIISLISCFINASCIKPANSTYISKVIDGDTFQDNENIRYRLLGVDTPESFDSANHFAETIGIQKFYANKATNLSTNQILHKNVLMKKWKLDTYKRMITRINYESKELAEQLLSQGLARVKYISPIPKNFFYYPDIDYYYQLLEIEKYAKVNKVGIWKLSPNEQKMVFPK